MGRTAHQMKGNMADHVATSARTRLLVIGPLPPPLAGTSVSFKIFCDEVRKQPDRLQLKVINSAPPHNLGQHSLFTAAHFTTLLQVLWQFCRKVWWADKVLIFGSNQFLCSLACICFVLARIAGKPCYLRAFGGSLDRFYSSRPAQKQFR